MTVLIGHRRRVYTPHHTPLERMPRLSAWLGGKTRLWIKRDDRTGLALGGNKTRKLEFLMSDAVDQACDTVITSGKETTESQLSVCFVRRSTAKRNRSRPRCNEWNRTEARRIERPENVHIKITNVSEVSRSSRTDDQIPLMIAFSTVTSVSELSISFLCLTSLEGSIVVGPNRNVSGDVALGYETAMTNLNESLCAIASGKENAS